MARLRPAQIFTTQVRSANLTTVVVGMPRFKGRHAERRVWFVCPPFGFADAAPTGPLAPRPPGQP
ncbi:MAG TPA: hypothetical protein VKA84_25465 [Gemmatimonadaceae bacterium]|nr:hypothetical protein [Gemmatimonadaceae bacterium]